ncbi:hypothetical protein HIMB100_00019300 [SAR116 cluster alpha proteobacterium HIMB100]|nr:hypothetical protein HIMB100_00019300 [SAR116 cluster alpha proteobacterium HIMB100]
MIKRAFILSFIYLLSLSSVGQAQTLNCQLGDKQFSLQAKQIQNIDLKGFSDDSSYQKVSCNQNYTVTFNEQTNSFKFEKSNKSKHTTPDILKLLPNGTLIGKLCGSGRKWICDKNREEFLSLYHNPSQPKNPQPLAELNAAQSKLEQLEAEIAALKSEKQTEQQPVRNNTSEPQITIASSIINGKRGNISGTVNGEVAVSEVRVDGVAVTLKSDGSFEWQGFVPAGGKSFTIEAIDTAGLSSMQQVRLERGQQNNSSGPLFDELNPFRGKTAKKNRNALAVIVGVSDYERTPDPAVYADKDAQYFQDYAAIKLGVPDNNIFTLINREADEVSIKKAVKNWLLRMSVKDETDVYVFFAGHGLASSDGTNMFLLPYDGDPELLEDSAIDRKQLFADIQAISPRSVTVFLDSCYSGGTRAGGTLVASLRPIAIRAKEQNAPEGFTILSAAKGDQTSQSLEEAKHGLFSYFLMRGLEGDADANNDNQITAGELHSFVTDKVERQSGFKQTPDLQGNAERVLVRFN